MNIFTGQITIPKNKVYYAAKYAAFPIFFLVLFFFGLKDAPVEITLILGIFFTAMDLSFIPYDIGKETEDEIHPYSYRVKPAFTAIWRTNVTNPHIPLTTKYYSRSSLLLAKSLRVFSTLLIIGVLLGYVSLYVWANT